MLATCTNSITRETSVGDVAQKGAPAYRASDSETLVLAYPQDPQTRVFTNPILQCKFKGRG